MEHNEYGGFYETFYGLGVSFVCVDPSVFLKSLAAWREGKYLNKEYVRKKHPLEPKIRKEINMAIRRLVVLSAFVFVAMVVFTSFASEKIPLRAQDRVEIEKLMWDYIQALDSGNAEAYAALFASDGQFGRGESAVKGRDALKKMVLDARKQMEADNEGDQKRPHMYHIVTNPHIEFIDIDHARYHAYWMGVLKTGGDIIGAGREVNELVRTDGRWFISIRDVDPQD